MRGVSLSKEILSKQRELDFLRERTGETKNRERLLRAWDRMRRIAGSWGIAPNSQYTTDLSKAHFSPGVDGIHGLPLEEQIHASWDVIYAQMMELIYLQSRYGHLLEESIEDLMGETVFGYLEYLNKVTGEGKQLVEPCKAQALRGELDDPEPALLDDSGPILEDDSGPTLLDFLNQTVPTIDS